MDQYRSKYTHEIIPDGLAQVPQIERDTYLLHKPLTSNPLRRVLCFHRRCANIQEIYLVILWPRSAPFQHNILLLPSSVLTFSDNSAHLTLLVLKNGVITTGGIFHLNCKTTPRVAVYSKR